MKYRSKFIFILLLAAATFLTYACNRSDNISPAFSENPSNTPTKTSTATSAPTSTSTPITTIILFGTPTVTDISQFGTLNCPTPIPTAGVCQQISNLNIIQGYASTSTSTVPPYLSQTGASGVLPVGGWVGTSNADREYIIRTAADWADYVATSFYPTGSYPIPFDPNTQMLIVLSSTSLNCCHAQNIQQICVTGTQITVYVQWNGGGSVCVDNVTTFVSGGGSLAAVLSKSSLPVVWVNPCGFPLYDCFIAN